MTALAATKTAESIRNYGVMMTTAMLRDIVVAVAQELRARAEVDAANYLDRAANAMEG